MGAEAMGTLMPDGALLLADLYRSPHARPAPTLLHRTPYSRATDPAGGSADIGVLQNAGFNVVTQSVRGRFGSAGRFVPYAQERQDGAATIEWITTQPWSDGVVAMVGRSYGGAAQWLAGATGSPLVAAALRALAPERAAADFYDGWTYLGGAFQLGFCLGWVLDDLLLGLGSEAAHVWRAHALAEIDEIFRAPWRVLDALGAWVPFYLEWLEHPAADAYWQQSGAFGDGVLDAPALVVTGWYDIFASGAIRDYTRHRSRSRASVIVVGPWAHLSNGDVLGDRVFAEGSLDLTTLYLAWYRHWLGPGSRQARAPLSGAYLYVMGIDRWAHFDVWPDGEADTAVLYFGPQRQLAADQPAASSHGDILLYDPRNPVPTCGGAISIPFDSSHAAAGPRDQRKIELRDDVLSYTSAPLSEPLAVAGRVEVVLHASSSARDTDFTANVIDVYPGGRAELLCGGVLRVRYRDGLDAPAPLVPGIVYRLVIDCGWTANVFPPGHRVRVDVSSSSFPRFDPNQNNAGPSIAVQPTVPVVALNEVLHSPRHASHVRLPVMPYASILAGEWRW